VGTGRGHVVVAARQRGRGPQQPVFGIGGLAQDRCTLGEQVDCAGIGVGRDSLIPNPAAIFARAVCLRGYITATVTRGDGRSF
jgi:hypothetical protein